MESSSSVSMADLDLEVDRDLDRELDRDLRLSSLAVVGDPPPPPPPPPPPNPWGGLLLLPPLPPLPLPLPPLLPPPPLLPSASPGSMSEYFQTQTRLSPLPVANMPRVGETETPMTEFLKPVTVATWVCSVVLRVDA